ncbi:MAG: low affinity iron permease family protein [Ferruginibacter sp.]
MKNSKKKNNTEKTGVNYFEEFATGVTKATGSTPAFLIAFLTILVWGISGPFFHYPENWQLVINTGTTIITFLMVFLIRKSQNKDSLAIQLKLNELAAAHEFASNRLVDVENMTEDELKIIRKYYTKLGGFTMQEENLQQSHSIDEAHELHDLKKQMEKELEEKYKK